MSAPIKNQNAAKPDAERLSSFLHIRTLPRDKAGWVKAAARSGKKLAEWATDALNSVAGKP